MTNDPRIEQYREWLVKQGWIYNNIWEGRRAMLQAIEKLDELFPPDSPSPKCLTCGDKQEVDIWCNHCTESRLRVEEIWNE